MFACWAKAFPQVGHLYGLTPAICRGFDSLLQIVHSFEAVDKRERKRNNEEQKLNYGKAQIMKRKKKRK